MPVDIEAFIPALLKSVKRNKGILDILEAKKIFGDAVVALAIKKEVVGEKTISLKGESIAPLRIPCITFEWDRSRPIWLDRYNKNTDIE
jgi:hypothetical protein